jgi:hypothetical protein
MQSGLQRKSAFLPAQLRERCPFFAEFAAKLDCRERTEIGAVAVNFGFFSGSASGSPICLMCAGEAFAITIRMHGECRLDFANLLSTTYSHFSRRVRSTVTCDAARNFGTGVLLGLIMLPGVVSPHRSAPRQLGTAQLSRAYPPSKERRYQEQPKTHLSSVSCGFLVASARTVGRFTATSLHRGIAI